MFIPDYSLWEAAWVTLCTLLGGRVAQNHVGHMRKVGMKELWLGGLWAQPVAGADLPFKATREEKGDGGPHKLGRS